MVEDYFGQTWIAPATVRFPSILYLSIHAHANANTDTLPQGEKGSVNIKVSVNVPGGHSSVPCMLFLLHTQKANDACKRNSPAHTAIGILSTLVGAIEAHPPPVSSFPLRTPSRCSQCV